MQWQSCQFHAFFLSFWLLDESIHICTRQKSSRILVKNKVVSLSFIFFPSSAETKTEQKKDKRQNVLHTPHYNIFLFTCKACQIPNVNNCCLLLLLDFQGWMNNCSIVSSKKLTLTELLLFLYCRYDLAFFIIQHGRQNDPKRKLCP